MKTLNSISTLAALTAVIFSFAFCTGAFGQQFPSKVSKEGIVLDGKVSTQKGTWSADRSTIYTINWFKPKTVFQGETGALDSIPVLTAGGATDEGLLAVTHVQVYYPGFSYLLALEPCPDCIDGMTAYLPTATIGEFQRKAYLEEKEKWANKPKTKSLWGESSCQGNGDTLFLRLGNVYLVPGLDSMSGHMDVKTKTRQATKILYSLSSKLKYDNEVLGDYAVSIHHVEVAPIGQDMVQAYTTTNSDLTYEKASFSLTKNANTTEALLVDSFYQSSIRIYFKTDSSNLQHLPQVIDSLFQLDEIEASYLCDGRVYPFRTIILDRHKIGVKIEGLVTPITYSFEDVTFNSTTNEYSFTVFASSDEPTYLDVAHLEIDFAPAPFFFNQVTNGYASVDLSPGTILADNLSYTYTLEDLNTTAILMVIQETGVFSVGALAMLDATPKALCRISLTMAICLSAPGLVFQEFEMQELSLYYTAASFPMPLVYEPVYAFDTENTIACSCVDDPVITGWSPEEIVAGDNQVLTITGHGFGVYERGADPGMSGTGSSVLFTNGDDHTNNPQFIAAAQEDFRVGGILKWTDTEIQVKVPSTSHVIGINGPASTGKFRVRNRCNKVDESDDDLKIPYSLTNFRLGKEKVAKRLGLRNNNGLSGNQDGYEFQFGANVTSPAWVINIPKAFDDALSTWCDKTKIRFKRKVATTFAPVAANDGINHVIVGALSTPNAQAALAQSQAYFPIDCQGSNPNDEDGGFIMSDLDIIINDDFATTGTQSRARRVLEHELGHGHCVNHARCFGTLCGGPLMHPEATTGIKAVDVDGGNRIFDDSQEIIANGCTGASVPPVKIEKGGCGTLVANKEEHAFDLHIFPNPTADILWITRSEQPLSWTVSSASGQVIASGKSQLRDFEIDFSTYPPGTYLLFVSNDKGTGQYKIVKL